MLRRRDGDEGGKLSLRKKVQGGEKDQEARKFYKAPLCFGTSANLKTEAYVSQCSLSHECRAVWRFTSLTETALFGSGEAEQHSAQPRLTHTASAGADQPAPRVWKRTLTLLSLACITHLLYVVWRTCLQRLRTTYSAAAPRHRQGILTANVWLSRLPAVQGHRARHSSCCGGLAHHYSWAPQLALLTKKRGNSLLTFISQTRAW